jgi:hypothetical protein
MFLKNRPVRIIATAQRCFDNTQRNSQHCDLIGSKIARNPLISAFTAASSRSRPPPWPVGQCRLV